MTISRAQQPEPVETKYGTEYVVTINGQQFRAISPAHIRAIETQQAELVSANKIVVLQADHIESLKRQVGLQQQLSALDARLVSLKNDQLKQFQLLGAAQKDAITRLDAIRGEQPKKSFLDKLPVRFGIAFLGAASNGRTLFSSPCSK